MEIPLETELATPQPFASGRTNVYKVNLDMIDFDSNIPSFPRV
jgi:hypothetical protein